MASNAFFLPTEMEWLVKRLTRYFQMKERGPDRTVCGRKILDRFYVEFPYRHPRYFDVVRIDEHERGLVIHGDEWKHMQEVLSTVYLRTPAAAKLRVLAAISTLGKLKKGEEWFCCSSVIGSQCLQGAKRSKVLEEEDTYALYPTQEQLAEETSGEAFFDVEAGNPYSIDGTTLQRQLELTLSRLDAYGASDYACMPDDQRDFATRSLQQDLHNIVQLLNAKTGGAFYIFGAWHNKEEGYRWGSATSENLRSMPIQELESVESFEAMAITHEEKYIGISNFR
ncbi:hypothetical protein BDV93DRAFT_555182 [Ceratobasidium sp. AG-I]|nr:hypothetical protein BDV93DRAFT_555182 [Ceratobasidium sp. AG-I]